jgi:hypothetical protein
VRGVHDSDNGVELELRVRVANVGPEGGRDGARIREPARLDEHAVEAPLAAARHELLEHDDEVVTRRAAEAAVLQLVEAVGRRARQAVLEDEAFDAHLVRELVLDDRHAPPVHRRQHVAQQRRLAAAEEARHDRDGHARGARGPGLGLGLCRHR